MGRDYDQIREQLASNIRALRSQKGLSQEALALSANLDRTYISQIERSVGNPSLLVLNKLAAVLDVDVVVLLTLEAQERSSEDTVSHISKLGA
jgi:transcriptional regulator with XRE-family HTH domain